MLITKRVIIVVLLVVFGVIAWFLLDWWIVTDRERIEALLERARVAAEKADWRGVMANVATDYNDDGVTYAELKAIALRASKLVGKVDIHLVAKEIKIDGDHAEVKFTAITFPNEKSNGSIASRVQSRWQLGLEKRGGDWWIVSVRPIAIAGMSVSSIKELPFLDP